MRLTIADALRVDEILARVARAELMPRFGRLSAGQVRAKSSRFDVVTDADEAAELAMATALTAAYPDAVVVGEGSSPFFPVTWIRQQTQHFDGFVFQVVSLQFSLPLRPA